MRQTQLPENTQTNHQWIITPNQEFPLSQTQFIIPNDLSTLSHGENLYQTGYLYEEKSPRQFSMVTMVGIKKVTATSAPTSTEILSVANILYIVDFSLTHKLLIMPHYGNTNLHQLMKATLPADAMKLTTGNFTTLFLSSLHELKKIHDKDIIHCDIKPSNIIVIENFFFTIRYIDFDGAVQLPQGQLPPTEKKIIQYTSGYMPSKFIQDASSYPLSKAVDLFTLGMTLAPLFACVQNPLDPQLQNLYSACLCLLKNPEIGIQTIIDITQRPHSTLLFDFTSTLTREFVAVLSAYVDDLMAIENKMKKIKSTVDYLTNLNRRLCAITQMDKTAHQCDYFIDFLKKIYTTQLTLFELIKDSLSHHQSEIFVTLANNLNLQIDCCKTPALKLKELFELIDRGFVDTFSAENLFAFIKALIRKVNLLNLSDRNRYYFNDNDLFVNTKLTEIAIQTVTPKTTPPILERFTRPAFNSIDRLSYPSYQEHSATQFFLIGRLILTLLGYTKTQDCPSLRRIYHLLLGFFDYHSISFILFEKKLQGTFSTIEDSESLEALQLKLINTTLLELLSHKIGSHHHCITPTLANLFNFLHQLITINLTLLLKSDLLPKVLHLMIDLELKANIKFSERESTQLITDMSMLVNIENQQDNFSAIVQYYLFTLLSNNHSEKDINYLIRHSDADSPENNPIYLGVQKILVQVYNKISDALRNFSPSTYLDLFSQKINKILETLDKLQNYFCSKTISLTELKYFYRSYQAVYLSSLTLAIHSNGADPHGLFYHPGSIYIEGTLQIMVSQLEALDSKIFKAHKTGHTHSFAVN